MLAAHFVASVVWSILAVALLQQNVVFRLVVLDYLLFQFSGPFRAVGQADCELNVVAIQVHRVAQPAVAGALPWLQMSQQARDDQNVDSLERSAGPIAGHRGPFQDYGNRRFNWRFRSSLHRLGRGSFAIFSGSVRY